MYQGLSVRRRWLALALVLFGFPLFVGLRSLDLETDEAIYSFAVDRMLADGEWLQPKSSPSDTAVFLEKPPLKFWIVAAPIRLGLLPHDEFGLRFWDACFGLIAFGYIFALGCRLAGPICGGVALLVLFVHWPLVFDHGLRTNNMEGALFLAYCGGMWHAAEWARGAARSARHAFAVGLYFTLGFLTKFVAIAFLPGVAGAAALLFASPRHRLWAERRVWGKTALIALGCILPWFAYAQWAFGSLVWQTMLAEHVYARFTASLNPEHVHPWHYYVTTMATIFGETEVLYLVPFGLLVLLLQSIRRRWFDGSLVVLWAVLPLGAISLGSSKLYHYAYPFLPPLALAVGYTCALVVLVVPPVLRRWLERLEDVTARRWPTWRAWAAKSGAERVATTVMAVAALLAVWALLFGQARVEYDGRVLFKSSGVVRPVLLILVVAAAFRRSAQASVLVVALGVAYWLPLRPYERTMGRLVEEKHPLRTVTDCIRDVQRMTVPPLPTGLYVDSDSSMWHPIVFYFRRIAPWIRQESAAPDRLLTMTRVEGDLRPTLVQEARYRDYLSGPQGDRFRDGGTTPMIGLFEYALLLPGPYRACSSEAALVAR